MTTVSRGKGDGKKAAAASPAVEQGKFADYGQRLAVIRPVAGRLLLGALVMLIAIAMQLAFPQAIAYFIDHTAAGDDTSWLTLLALLMLAAFVVYCAATAWRYYLFESAGTMIVTDVRRTLYGAIIRREIGFFDTHALGELLSRLSSDVDVLKELMSMSIALALRSLLVCIGGTVFLVSLSPQLSLLVLLIIPVSLALARHMGTRVRDKSKALQAHLAKCVQAAQESFGSIRLVHAFNRQRTVMDDYHRATERPRCDQRKASANRAHPAHARSHHHDDRPSSYNDFPG